MHRLGLGFGQQQQARDAGAFHRPHRSGLCRVVVSRWAEYRQRWLRSARLGWDRAQAKPFPFDKLTANAAIPSPVYLPLVGHHGPVRSVKFFPDNTSRVMSTSQDNTVRIWDAASGRTIQTLRGHSGRVSSAAFVDRGQRILSASHDRLLKLWKLSRYEEVRVLRGKLLAGHADAVLGVNFSRDAQQIVTASRDRSAKIWNPADGELIATLSEGHDFLATTVALFPDHKRFATAALDNTTRIWEHRDGGRTIPLERHRPHRRRRHRAFRRLACYRQQRRQSSNLGYTHREHPPQLGRPSRRCDGRSLEPQ